MVGYCIRSSDDWEIIQLNDSKIWLTNLLALRIVKRIENADYVVSVNSTTSTWVT